MVGQQVNSYSVIGQIRSGGMATIYLECDVFLDRDVVIKIMLPAVAENEKLMLHFQRDARATAWPCLDYSVAVFQMGKVDPLEPRDRCRS